MMSMDGGVDHHRCFLITDDLIRQIIPLYLVKKGVAHLVVEGCMAYQIKKYARIARHTTTRTSSN